MKTRLVLPTVFVAFCLIGLIWILGLFLWPQQPAPDPAVQERETRKDTGYTVSESIYTLSDGRKVICLQAPYGGLWCTPTLDKAGS